jgi:hypothetical protein
MCVDKTCNLHVSTPRHHCHETSDDIITTLVGGFAHRRKEISREESSMIFQHAAAAAFALRLSERTFVSIS